MAEARSRRELPPRPRTRLKTDSDDGVDRPEQYPEPNRGDGLGQVTTCYGRCLILGGFRSVCFCVPKSAANRCSAWRIAS